MNIELKQSRSKPKNVLAGAVDIAIRQAERFDTPLVIKRNGRIEELTPAQMRRLSETRR